MRKIYLSLVGLAIAASGYSQTTIETALPLKNGENVFTNEQSKNATDIYWSYTSTKDEIIIADPVNSSCLTCWEIDEDEDEIKPILGGQYTYQADGKWYVDNVYPVPAGHTVYVRANSSEKIGFKADIRESHNVLGGTDQNHWGEIVPGTMQYFGNDANNIKRPIYAKVTPTADGVLKFTTNSPVGYALDENGVQYHFDKSDETYASTAVVKVVGGRENKLRIYSYGPMVFSTEFYQPTLGEYENPFELKSGANILPKDAGTYWYIAAAQNDCMLNFTGNSTLGGGQASIFKSTYDVLYKRPALTSLPGKIDMSYPATAGATYYIKVEKKTATAADETFTFGYDDYKDGDVESHPIVISEFPNSFTVPAGKTVYYAMNVPAGEVKMLTVDATAALGKSISEAASALLTDNDTHVSVYQPSFTEVKNNSYVRTKLYGGAEGATYTIKWVSKNQSDFKFDIKYEELEDGDDVSKPITAVIGDNVYTSAGTKFYTHKATQSGKFMVTVPDGVTVMFPKTALLYEGQYDTSVKGNTYSIDVTKGNDYIIEFVDCVEGAKFHVAYGEWTVGETSAKPIEVEGDEYVLTDADNGTVWLKYTGHGDNVLTIDATDIPADGNKANYCFGSNIGALHSMYSSTDDGAGKFFTVVSLTEAGEYYLVQLELSKSYAGKSIKFTEREAGEGESVNKPLILLPNEPLNLGTASEMKPVWVKATFTPGIIYFSCNGWITATLYNSKDEAKQNLNGAQLLLLQTEGTEQGSTQAKFERSLEVSEGSAGDHYIKLTGAWGSQLTATGDGITTGITNVGSDKLVKAEAYYGLNGMKLQAPQKGVNIVKLSDGRTVKMICQ